MPDPRPSDEPEPIANAASVFDTDEIRPYKAPESLTRPATAPTPAPPPPSTPASDGYDLEVDPFPGESALEPPRPPVLPAPVERPKVARPKASAQPRPQRARHEDDRAPVSGGDTSEFETEFSEVDPAWSRLAEWMPDLARVGMAAVGTLVAVAVFWSFGWGWLGWLALLAGGAGTVLLTYPIMITLERPVRITPEQAVTDFFAAASHHFPHYRRMWLLLSSSARQAGRFAEFADFRDHWEDQVGAWRTKAGVGKFTPLKFDVEDFRADKSTGKETSKADYTVHVSVRDKEADGPLASFRMSHGLVKGPDRMWYLNRGVLESKPR